MQQFLYCLAYFMPTKFDKEGEGNVDVKDEREEVNMGDMVEERCNRSCIAFS